MGTNKISQLGPVLKICEAAFMRQPLSKNLKMKTSQFSKSQQMAIIAQRQTGASVEEICRINQISPATFYKWEKAMKDDQDDNKRRIKQLEQENARLKKMYAELMIDHEILQEGYEVAKKISAQSKKKR